MAAVRNQLVVFAAFDDAPFVHYRDLIRVLNGRQSMRNDQRSAVAHQSLQGLLD